MFIRKISKNVVKPFGTLLEGEYVNGILLVYNCLYYGGIDVRSRALYSLRDESRLKYVDMAIADIKLASVRKMPMELSSNFNKISKLWKQLKDEYPVDGLIFTPMNDSYPIELGTWNKLLKWKPPEFNSIDFLIRTEKNKEGEDVIKFNYNKLTGDNFQYKVLTLKVGGYATVNNKNNNKWIKKRIAKNFNPDEKKKTLGKANVRINSQGIMEGIDPATKEIFHILDDTIVEFTYDATKTPFNWIPIRVRYDKTEKYKNGEPIYGNTEEVANDNWRSIMNPVTVDILTTGEFTQYELEKDVIANEINKNIAIAQSSKIIRRVHNKEMINDLIDEVGGGRFLNLSSNKEENTDKEIDIIGIFEFGNNPDILTTALKKSPKYIVGTFINSDRIKNLLGNKTMYNNEEWEIEKLYKVRDKYKRVRITEIDDTPREIIGLTETEMKKIVNKYNLELVKIEPIQSDYKLAQLYDKFILREIEKKKIKIIKV